MPKKIYGFQGHAKDNTNAHLLTQTWTAEQLRKNVSRENEIVCLDWV